MRVTNKMLHTNLLRNLNRNLNMMSKTQEQMSSGKKVSRPSDNPIDVTLIMGMKSILSEQETHIKNMEDGIGWLEATDQALANLGEVVKRASELALQGANGTASQDARIAIAQEIGQLIDEAKQIINTNYAGRYIFGGTNTSNPPVDGSNQFRGNSFKMNWEIGPGVTIAINTTGEVFNGGTVGTPPYEPQMITVLKDLKTALEDSSGDPSASIGELDKQMDAILNERAAVGAKSRRLEMAKSRAEEVNLDLGELTSKLEDIDIAEVSMTYAMQEAVYQAALMTGARILQPTLLNFLR